MRTRTLGRAGIDISELGFGAWAIGGAGEGFSYGEVSEQEALACLEAYIEGGGNHIDTARYYNESERIIGLILQDRGVREQLVIATKTFENDAQGIREELGRSLELLRTDYVDIYYLHQPPDDAAEMDRALDVMEELRAEGTVRAIGASIKGPDVTQATVDLCRQYIHSGRVDVIQLIYSILRQKLRAVFDEARANGVGLVGRTSLESGLLTGKYEPGHEFAGSDHRQRWAGERLRRVLECARDLKDTVVGDAYETLAQVVIRFAMIPEAIVSTIVGAKSVKQTRANLAAVELPPLDEELVGRLVREYGERTEEFNSV